MAENANRKLRKKRIFSPSDNSVYIEIPIVDEATFVTAADQYQEGHFYFNNSAKSARKTRVQQVTHPSTGNSLLVERIQSFFTKTAAEQYQETEWALKNTDPPPIQPDGSDSPAHQKKHIVRYFRNNDDSSQTWVDIELIDQLNAILPQDQHQEWQLILRNADLGDPVSDPSVPYSVTKGFCDPDLPLAEAEPGFDPPYRLDPLQNIINFNMGPEINLYWAFQAYLKDPPLSPGTLNGGYDFKRIYPTTDYQDGTDPNFVVTGKPIVSDVVWSGVTDQPSGYPWWLIGDDVPIQDPTANPTGQPEHVGYNYYDAFGSTASLNLTWPFSAGNFEIDSPNIVIVPCGTLTASFGPISLVKDGVAWTQVKVHVAMYARQSSDYFGIVDWMPGFIATFEPPTS